MNFISAADIYSLLSPRNAEHSRWQHWWILHVYWFLENPALTLCATHLAGLHETQQGNEVFNDAEVLGPWRAAGVDGHGYQQLLDVTHQELVVIQGNTAEDKEKQKNMKHMVRIYHS